MKYLAEYSTDCLWSSINIIGIIRRIFLLLKRRRCFTHGHTSGYRPSLQILISVLLIFLLSVYNRNILLIIPIILILDRRQSVVYSARYFLFLFSDFIYLFMLVPTYLKISPCMIDTLNSVWTIILDVTGQSSPLCRNTTVRCGKKLLGRSRSPGLPVDLKGSAESCRDEIADLHLGIRVAVALSKS